MPTSLWQGENSRGIQRLIYKRALKKHTHGLPPSLPTDRLANMKFAKNYRSVTTFLESHRNCIVLPASLHDCYWQQKLPQIYSAVSLYLADGMPLVLWNSLVHRTTVDRLYGPEFMDSFIIQKAKKSHLLLGTKEAVEQLREKYSNVEIHRLQFSNDPKKLVNNSLISLLNNHHYDYIWIGISSPKQVALASLLQPRTNAHIFCVGAAFDFMSGMQPQAPNVVQQWGLEWLYRLLHNPRRLWRRYLIRSPLGLFWLVTRRHQII